VIIYLMMGLIVLAFVAFLVLIVGGLVGAFVGGIIGGASARKQARLGRKTIATFSGAAWGACLGSVVALAMSFLLLLMAWSYLCTS
jgi:hypothetical protein